MKMMSIRILVLLLLNLIVVSRCDEMNDFLIAHNNARASVNVGAIQWDSTVAAYAKSYADRQRDMGSCGSLVHSQGEYGENLAYATSDMSPTDAVNLWTNEKQKYNYDSNSCFGGECGHYTQVVWRGSTTLGCASSRCNDGSKFIICNYNPRGNIQGKRPY